MVACSECGLHGVIDSKEAVMCKLDLGEDLVAAAESIFGHESVPVVLHKVEQDVQVGLAGDQARMQLMYRVYEQVALHVSTRWWTDKQRIWSRDVSLVLGTILFFLAPLSAIASPPPAVMGGFATAGLLFLLIGVCFSAFANLEQQTRRRMMRESRRRLAAGLERFSPTGFELDQLETVALKNNLFTGAHSPEKILLTLSAMQKRSARDKSKLAV